ncbi:GIY-YIG nuclease family protein [Azorhizobium caulinodans]|uniref:GIY-YIG nuclease family protein n=1 Tax=Azorhizobium caulinodans TaxID=7 RepID=UPI002FBF068E
MNAHTSIKPASTHAVALSADEQVAALRARLEPTNARIDYVSTLLRPMLGLGEATTRNAFYAAGRMLTCSTAMARHIVSLVSRKGSAEAAQAWRADTKRGALPPLSVGPLPPNMTGIIYFVRSGIAPEGMKVGFTCNLPKRLRDLKTETGEEHHLEAWMVGTLADEAVAHLLLAQRRMSDRKDWFYLGDPEARQIPSFLPISRVA